MTNDRPNNDLHGETLVRYWLEKAQEALESAKSEYKAGRLSFAINRIYYACFYAVSAVLRERGKKFKKHKGVRSALHRDMVKNGVIEERWGRFYDDVFESRQRGDYQPIVSFESEQVEEYIRQADGFLKEMEKLLIRKPSAH